jgi:hypothetical protein
MVSVAAVLAASEHPAPSTTWTTWAVVSSVVGVPQPENPAPRVAVALEVAKPLGNVMATTLPELRAPPDELVKPMVQVAEGFAET